MLTLRSSPKMQLYNACPGGVGLMTIAALMKNTLPAPARFEELKLR